MRTAGAVRRFAIVSVLLGACSHERHAVAVGESGASSSVGSDASSSAESSSTGDAAAQRGALVIRGARVVGVGEADVLVRGGKIARIGAIADDELDGAQVLDERGHFIAPAFVDSHVHLSYAFDARTLAAGGVAAAVDLAAPIAALAEPCAPLQLLGAGPMITAQGGYPTQSWGAGGFGLEVTGVPQVQDAVDRVIDAGAAVVKVPIGAGPDLTDDELRALVDRAHARGRRVVAHALGEADAAKAAAIGVDVLAHTPTEALSDDTVLAWSSGTVISTLSAFGPRADTLDNLRRLRAAGTTVLYGTDLGNTGIPAIDHNEIDALLAAGLDADAILAAGTATPASFWGLDDLGALAEGKRASFLVLASDPTDDPHSLAQPLAVWIDGELQPQGFTAGGEILP